MRLRVLLRFLVLALPLAAQLRADSTLNFPRLSQEAGTFTGIAIVNPNSAPAKVTLTAFGSDGQPLTGITNPATLTIPPKQQVSKLTTEIFGAGLDPATVGWFQATSTVNDLTGFFLFLNDTSTIFDGADLPASAQSIAFNQVRTDPGFSTELNILNPGSATANLQLQLISPGADPLVKSLTLGGKALARLDAADFFATTSAGPGSYVRVDADAPVAGFEFLRQAAGDLLGLDAVDVSQQLTVLYFPQLAVLGDWKTQLGLVNYSQQAVIATISAFRPDGTLYGTADLKNNPVTLGLAPGESLSKDVETLFGFSGSQTLDGWIKVESTSPALNGFVSYGQLSSGSAASVTSPAAGSKRAIFSHIATVQGFFTGIAFLNPGQLAADVLILALKPDGTLLGSHSTALQPGQRVSKLINELIPEAAGQGGGFIWVKSSSPLFLTSLFGKTQVLANIPPQAAPLTFQPDVGLNTLDLAPTLTIMFPNSTNAFQLIPGQSPVNWAVNGIPGGNSTVGTISPQGVYTAPATPPANVVTVTAEANGQTAGASVDVLEKSSLLSTLSVVQSVAYLDSLQSLFTAELSILSATGGEAPLLNQGTPAQQTIDSEIFQVSAGGSKSSLVKFPGEKISKMIPFRASTGADFLLAAAETSGRILRLDPQTGASTEIASGLDAPSALVLDEKSGDLFVAEKTKITLIPKSLLQKGLTSKSTLGPSKAGRHKASLFTSTTGIDGVAVDNCTGSIYTSSSKTGEIRQFSVKGGLRTVVKGLRKPTRLLATYRQGVPCPDSFHLLVVEQGTDRILLVLPRAGVATFWATARQSTDLIFLPATTPFVTGKRAVLLSEVPVSNAGFELSAVPVEEEYQDEPETSEIVSTRLLSAPNLKAALGDRVNVDVELNEGADIARVEFLMEYDPDILSLVQVTGGTLLADHTVTSDTTNPGLVRVTVESPTSASLADGSGSLAVLTFDILASGVSDLSFEEARALDEDGDKIEIDTLDGTLGDRIVVDPDEVPTFDVRVLSLPEVTPSPNSQVFIPVDLSDGTNLESLEFRLDFDPDLLGFAGSQGGELLTDHQVSTSNPSPGELEVKISSPGGNPMNPDSGSVVLLIFDVLDTGSSDLELDDAFAVDTDGFALDLAVTDGEVVVSDVSRTLSISDLEAMPGDQVVVPVELDEGQDIAELFFDVEFDPAILTPLEVRPGTLLSDHVVSFEPDSPSSISIEVESLSFSSMNPGSGSVVVIVFQVLAPGISPLTIEDVEATDTLDRAVSFSASNGSLGEAGGRILSAPSLTAFRGEKVRVPLEFNEGMDLFSISFDLEYDPDVVQAGSVFPGSLLSASDRIKMSRSQPGILTISIEAAGVAGLKPGSGTLAEVDFEVVGFGTSPLDFSDISALDTAQQPLAVTGVSGSLGDGTVTSTGVARTLLVPELSAQKGDPVTVTVGISDGKDLAHLEFGLEFDPEVLAFQSASPGSLATDHTVTVSESPPGFLTVTLSSPSTSGMGAGPGSVLTLVFDTLEEGFSDLIPSDARASDKDGMEVRVETVQGSVLVESSQGPSPTPGQRALSVGVFQARPGDQVVVPVRLNEGEGISSLSFDLSWDESVLSFVEARPGTLLEDHTVSAQELGAATLGGVVAISIDSPQGLSLKAGSGSVVELVFTADATGFSELALGAIDAFDPNDAPVDVVGVDGSVEVSENAPAPGARMLMAPNVTTAPGDTLILPMILDDGDSVAEMRFTLEYDATILAILDVGPGNLLTDHAVSTTSNPGSLEVRIKSASGSGMLAGPGSVVEIRVQALVAGSSSLRISQLAASDTGGTPLQIAPVDGSLTVESTSSSRVLQAPFGSGQVGEPVMLPVGLSDGQDVAAAIFDLDFDPSILQVSDVTPGTLLTDHLVSFQVGSGSVHVSVSSATGAGMQPGPGSLVEVLFDPVAAGTSSTHLTSASLTDTGGQNLPLSTQDGSITISASATPAPTSRTLGAPTASVPAGTQVTLPMGLDEGAGLASLSFTLTFDPALVSVSSVGPGTLLADHQVSSSASGSGTLTVTISSPTSSGMTSGSGSVVEITFDALAPGTSQLALSGATASDTQGMPVTVSTVDGSLTVEAAMPVARTLAAPTGMVTAGAQVTLPFGLDEGSGIASLSFTLSFDTTLVSVSSVAPGSLLTDHQVSFSPLASQPGGITVAISSPTNSALMGGPGSVVEITFDALAPGTSPLALSVATATDTLGIPVTVNTVDGSLTVNASTSATRTLTAPTSSATVGAPVTLPVLLDDGTDLTSVSFTLTFDPALVSISSVGPGTLLTDHEVLSNVSGGSLTITLSSPTIASMLAGPGSVVEITFLPLAAGVSPLSLSGATATDVLLAAVTVSTVDGSLTIQ